MKAPRTLREVVTLKNRWVHQSPQFLVTVPLYYNVALYKHQIFLWVKNNHSWSWWEVNILSLKPSPKGAPDTSFLQKVHVVSGKASSQSSLVCMQPTGRTMTIRTGRCSKGLGCKDWQSEGSPPAMANPSKRSRVRCRRTIYMERGWLQSLVGIPSQRLLWYLVSSEKVCVRGRLGNKRGPED